MKMIAMQNVMELPIVKIIPQNARFDDPSQANIEVRFFTFAGNLVVFSPTVYPNIVTCEHSPEDAYEWGQMLIAAALIAQMDAAALFHAPGCDDTILGAWVTVDEMRAEQPAPAQVGA